MFGETYVVVLVEADPPPESDVVRTWQGLRDHGKMQPRKSASDVVLAGRRTRELVVSSIDTSWPQECESAKQRAWEVVTDAALREAQSAKTTDGRCVAYERL